MGIGVICVCLGAFELRQQVPVPFLVAEVTGVDRVSVSVGLDLYQSAVCLACLPWITHETLFAGAFVSEILHRHVGSLGKGGDMEGCGYLIGIVGVVGTPYREQYQIFVFPVFSPYGLYAHVSLSEACEHEVCAVHVMPFRYDRLVVEIFYVFCREFIHHVHRGAAPEPVAVANLIRGHIMVLPFNGSSAGLESGYVAESGAGFAYSFDFEFLIAGGIDAECPHFVLCWSAAGNVYLFLLLSKRDFQGRFHVGSTCGCGCPQRQVSCRAGVDEEAYDGAR